MFSKTGCKTMDNDDIVAKGDAILAHYGVKGMKWGVKKGEIDSAKAKKGLLTRKADQKVTVKQKPGKFVRTQGGKRNIASNDAVRVAASRQMAKKSTTDSLSTKQLQDAVQRMNLEEQYLKLAKKSDRRSRGQKFAQAVFRKGGDLAIQTLKVS
jgi:hypothetical protein